MTQVVEGNVVSIYYQGSLDDGTVFDETEKGEPLEFIAGGEEVIEGISQAVIGMSVGDKKRVEVPPEKAYGYHDPELEQTIPRSELPEDVEVGDQLTATAEDEEDDEEFVVWVLELNDDEAVIDANHPLAGETLFFDIELVAVDG